MKKELTSKQERALKYAWLGLGDVTSDKIGYIGNPLALANYSAKELENPGLREITLMRDPEYLFYAAKTLLGIDLLPEQSAILEELWIRPFPMFVASRGFGKSWLMALYCVLKMILTPPAEAGGAAVKIVIVGAAFRQSKVIWEYMETIWRNAPILRSLCDQNSGCRKDVDRCTVMINQNWTIAVPLGDGSKIRGLRATIVIADEFGSVPPDIYETVVQGFAAVSAEPVKNVQEVARRKMSQKMGVWSKVQEMEFIAKAGNQIIIAGTADYDFKHYADYWKRYCKFIRSEGNPRKLTQAFEIMDEVPADFNNKNYGVMRIPYALIPKGFMDDKIVTRARATVHSGIYQMEYGAVFTSDSDGFYKRSLIESCVASDRKPVQLISGPVYYDSLIRGDKQREYVYGVDPASEADNFSIVIEEMWPDHQRIVYTWTTNREDFKRRQKAGLTDTTDFYGFCARKIRDLMKVFPPAESHPFGSAIGMDAQGGGIAVMEALHDRDKLRIGEIPLWPIINPDKKADTDDEQGLHILEMVQFADATWTGQANHGLRKDMEDKSILFPRFDPVTLELATANDKIRSDTFKEVHGKELTIYDSLEDCVMEIEELKNELTTIVMTRTGTGVGGRDRWDTPEVKIEGGRKGRLRKDRYSSLVIANMLARQIKRGPTQMEYDMVGGFTDELAGSGGGQDRDMYSGPEWFTKGMNDISQFIG